MTSLTERALKLRDIAQAIPYGVPALLARAAIAGINAIRAVLPGARIVNVDPLCRVTLPPDQPELAAETEYFNEVRVFELGADDFLTKPFRARALSARLEAVLGRRRH